MMEESLDIISADDGDFSKLLQEQQRLETFKKWPNDPDWNCTPQKLAEAGFYHKPCPEAPDNACCVFCKKELDGWEPDDNPMKEHKKHSPKCPFISLRKPLELLTILEVTKFIIKVATFHKEKYYDRRLQDFKATAKEAREIMVECNSNKK